MNILNILDEIEKVDAEVYERLNPRRKAMKDFFNLGSKIALASVPLAMGSMFKKAYGQSTAGVLGVLNFALTLEYLERYFYERGTDSVRVAAYSLNGQTALEKTYLQSVTLHEQQHVDFLVTAIKAAGGTPVSYTAAQFDYRAKGSFNDIDVNYDTFLAVANALEDTGVRAYKGQAPNLMGSGSVLTAALNIHSVEARHASAIRLLRHNRTQAGVPNIKPWITQGNDIGTSKADLNYAGEANVTQGGVNITSLAGVGGNISSNAATEAFDEPLSKEKILEIVTPFFV